jgi:hypothetical protein
LVPRHEFAEAQGVLDLLLKLDVGRDTEVALQAELEHPIFILPKYSNMQSYDTYNPAKSGCQAQLGA